MNWYFVAAAVLGFIVALIHSVMGEKLIFQRMRAGGFIPTNGGALLREPHVRILWATWHIPTAMCWCLAAALLWLAFPSSKHLAQSLVVQVNIVSMGAGSVLVLVGTKGRHPGWVGLLAVAVLTVLGTYS